MSGLLARATALLLTAAVVAPPDTVSPEQHLASGIAFVKEGDFESAIPRLSAAIQGLSLDARRRAELARAYLFLGVAYLELGQALEARGKFREALRNDPKISLSPREFSRQVIRIFEEERLAAQPEKKGRNLLLPLVLVAGGGAASAGIVAAGGGNSPSPSPTTAPPTTTQPSGGPSPSTPPTTAPPGPTTTQPGPTTTTTSTTLPISSTTTMPVCSYSLFPNASFGILGGTGVCNVSVSSESCSWSVEVFPAANWLTLNGQTSGIGNGSISYTVAGLSVGTRSARIRAQQDRAAGCQITQNALLVARSAQLAWTSRLELAGGRGQVVVNGTEAVFQDEAPLSHTSASRDGLNRIEAYLVTGPGRPGTWRFELLSGAEPASLRVIAGRVALVGGNSIVFRLSGAPGERIVFAFRGAR